MADEVDEEGGGHAHAAVGNPEIPVNDVDSAERARAAAAAARARQLRGLRNRRKFSRNLSKGGTKTDQATIDAAHAQHPHLPRNANLQQMRAAAGLTTKNPTPERVVRKQRDALRVEKEVWQKEKKRMKARMTKLESHKNDFAKRVAWQKKASKELARQHTREIDRMHEAMSTLKEEASAQLEEVNTLIFEEKRVSAQNIRAERRRSARKRTAEEVQHDAQIEKSVAKYKRQIENINKQFAKKKNEYEQKLKDAGNTIANERIMWYRLEMQSRDEIDASGTKVSGEKKKSRETIQKMSDKFVEKERRLQERLDDLEGMEAFYKEEARLAKKGWAVEKIRADNWKVKAKAYIDQRRELEGDNESLQNEITQLNKTVEELEYTWFYDGYIVHHCTSNVHESYGMLILSKVEPKQERPPRTTRKVHDQQGERNGEATTTPCRGESYESCSCLGYIYR